MDLLKVITSTGTLTSLPLMKTPTTSLFFFVVSTLAGYMASRVGDVSLAEPLRLVAWGAALLAFAHGVTGWLQKAPAAYADDASQSGEPIEGARTQFPFL